jgi:hypothetical protein
VNVELDARIQFIARSLLGSAQLRSMRYKPDSIPALVRKVTSEMLGKEVAIAAFDAESTELFSVTSLPVPVIVHSSHYLEVVASIRWLLMFVDMAGDEITQMSRSLFLEVLAEKVGRRGFHDLGTSLLFLESWNSNSPKMSIRDNISDANLTPSMPSQSSLLIAIGFQLAHEVGHFSDMSTAIDRLVPVAKSRLDDSLRELAETRPYEGNLDQLAAFVCEDPGSPMHPRHVAEEMLADLFALIAVHQLLLQAVSSTNESRFSVGLVAVELIAQMSVTSWLERIEAMSHAWMEDKGQLERDAVRYRSAMMAVRLEHMIELVPTIYSSLPGLSIGESALEGEPGVLADVFAEKMRTARDLISARFGPVAAGVELAIEFLYSSNKSERLSAQHERLGNAAILAITEPRFVRHARAFCDAIGSRGDGLLTSALRNLLV